MSSNALLPAPSLRLGHAAVQLALLVGLAFTSACGDDDGSIVPGGHEGEDPNCDTQASCRGSIDGNRCLSGFCGCRKSADCTDSITPVCDRAIATCVGCVTDAHCPDWYPHCVESRCEECGTSSDCADYEAGHACIDQYCGCTSAADCTAGQRCHEGACIDPCESNADCTDGYSDQCIVATGLCGRCLTDAHCVANGDAQSSGSNCNAIGSCGCEIDSDCQSSRYGRVCMGGNCGCAVLGDCPFGTNCGQDGSCR